MTPVEVKLLVTTAEIIITKGLPAVMSFWEIIGNNHKEVPTIEDIESAKGELDSASYFD